jgi:hypothetical protein
MKKKIPPYDFITKDPKTGLTVEVKIIRICPPDAVYEVPLSGEVQANVAVNKVLRKLMRYISKLS